MEKLKIDLEEIYSEEYINEVVEAVKLMTNEFPILNDVSIKIVIGKIEGEYEQSFAVSKPIYTKSLTEFKIILNEKAFTNENINFLFEETRLNWNAFYYSISDVICHEYGHILHRFYIAKKLHLYPKLFQLKYVFKIIDVKNIQDKLLLGLLKNSFKKQNVIYNKNNIYACFGKNATKNSMELFSECINNYYRLKNINFFRDHEEKKYTFKISKEIVDNIKEILNT